MNHTGAANLMAALIQSMSAKLGIATEKNLPELCGEHFPKWISIFLWIQAELVNMATNLAEFIGASLGMPVWSSLRLHFFIKTGCMLRIWILPSSNLKI